jgi:4-amino-4-deoxy-L-arabinose transferase-like glycosyltransferase
MNDREASIHRETPADWRNALLCGLAVVAALGLINPISESPFNDDWSYSFTVKKLLETGHLTYNGWAAASMIAQAYWGLLWVKVFGFSYTVLRLSTLPLAAIAISLCYLLGRRVGLLPRFAVFAALTLGLCPLYLPVAGSFMTDVPGLFFIFLSMYLLARSIESPQTNPAIAWLIGGLFVGLIGGTDRQIVWVVPLAIAPYAAWIRRDNLVFCLVALLGSVLVLGGATVSMWWFAHQPYSVPEISIATQMKSAVHKPAHFLLNVLAIVLTLLWMILPAMWRIGRDWTTSRALVALLILIGPVMVLVKTRPHFALAPWMGNTITNQGVMGGAELRGLRPTALPMPVRIVIAVAVFGVACVLIADLLRWLSRPLTAFRRTIAFFLNPDPPGALLPAMMLFAAAYFILLLPRSVSDMAYDRYVIPLMPCVLFPLLLAYQQRGDRKVPAGAWVLLSVYTVYAIAGAQDVMALGRARATAMNRLIAGGISRTQIDSSFELNYETQIQTQGYINNHRMLNPPGKYNRNLPATPSVNALYRLEFNPGPDTRPTPFGSIPYLTFLPPFHRQVYMDKFIDAWWLDPHKAATRPSGNPRQIPPPTGITDETSDK